MQCQTVITEDLLQALNNGEFQPYIQPVVRTPDMVVSGGELLVRRLTPTGEVIPPTRFIEQVESAGLLSIITQKILYQTVSGITARTLVLPQDFRLAVNVTPALLEDRDFTRMCLWLSSARQIHLVLELTERLPFYMAKKMSLIMKDLSQAGVEFALDDFGTGCSVLSYLKDFPVSYIKIDRNFIQDILHDEVSRHIVESMVILAEKINIQTVAEGVETQGQMNCLRGLGVNYLQGFYLGKPLSLDTFLNQYL